jgi:phosphate transport system permease protein
VLHINSSIFSQGATMASVIANEFTEATEPFHLSALFVVGFWLLIVALIVNIIARLVVRRGVAL